MTALDKDRATWINIASPEAALNDAVTLRFQKCYSFSEPVKTVDPMHFAVCPYSGPIAICTPTDSAWLISIRSASGRLLKEKLQVPDIHSFAWTKDHQLIVLTHRGTALVYSAIGELLNEIYFGQTVHEIRDLLVFETQYDAGIAVLDEQSRVAVVNKVTEPIIWTLSPPSKEAVSSWAVLQQKSQLTRVILVYNETFYSGHQGEHLAVVDTPWTLTNGQYRHIEFRNDLELAAVYHTTGVIQIVASELTAEVHRISVVDSELAVLRLGWIGSSGLFTQNTSSDNDRTLYFYSAASNSDGHYELRTRQNISIEPDGIKLYGGADVTFVSIVSDAEKAVLGVVSQDDSAFLYEAAKKLDTNESHSAYENASMVRDMPYAIRQCILCAQTAWNVEIQKTLLKAAKFGMAFTSGYDTTEFVKVIKWLRVLNELRSSRLGIPMSYEQLQILCESNLLNRLIEIREFGEAMKIHDWTGIDGSDGADRILLNWVHRILKQTAASKAQYDSAEIKKLNDKITAKLSQYPHVSIADAAKRAIDAKLPTLARLLIKSDPDESKQVDVLLRLGDITEALEKAAATDKPQLILQVIKHLMKIQRRSEYELTIRKIPLAQCLYQELIREDSDTSHVAGRQMLALLEQASDYERQTLLHLDTAANEIQSSEKLNALRRAKDAAHNMGDKPIEEILADVAAFAPGQSQRNEDTLKIREAVIAHASDAAKVAQLKNQAKLTDKQVLYWTIEGLVKAGRMEQLFDMSQRKTNYGYLPFINACMKYNKVEECNKYFAKVTGYENLVAAHLAMGNYVTAAKMAFDRRDSDTLQNIFMKSFKDKDAYEKVGRLVKAMPR